MEKMKCNSRRIAILMATYNAEKYISEQIDSILNQSNQDWTLYIRDDGSKDDTQKIIDNYIEKYSNRIAQIDKGGGNLGCRDNFFELLLAVNSMYYMFSDADDFWLPEKIEWSMAKMMELETKYKDLPIVIHTDMVVTDSKLKVISPSMWAAGKINPDKIKSYNYLGIHGYVGGATMMFNRKAKDVSLPINYNVFMHDLWIGLCVIKQGIVYSLHKQTLLYRQHGNNSVGGASNEQLKFIYKICNIRKVLKVNMETYKMLNKIGYGPWFKYLYYKMKLIFLMRNGRMFKD